MRVLQAGNWLRGFVHDPLTSWRQQRGDLQDHVAIKGRGTGQVLHDHAREFQWFSYCFVNCPVLLAFQFFCCFGPCKILCANLFS